MPPLPPAGWCQEKGAEPVGGQVTGEGFHPRSRLSVTGVPCGIAKEVVAQFIRKTIVPIIILLLHWLSCSLAWSCRGPQEGLASQRIYLFKVQLSFHLYWQTLVLCPGKII